MEGKAAQETDDFRYFDPKVLKPSNTAPRGVQYSDAIVFVVGGGNYIEYQNLVDFCKVSATRVIWNLSSQ